MYLRVHCSITTAEGCCNQIAARYPDAVVIADGDYMLFERICNFRSAGLTLKNRQEIQFSDHQPQADIFKQRMGGINRGILLLKEKQRLLAKMHESVASVSHATKLNKEMWIDIL